MDYLGKLDGLSSEGWLEGSVTEVIDVGDYRYLCVNADNRSVWLATVTSLRLRLPDQ